MSAFSVFFMQSPSFLAHQRLLETGHGRSNCASLFGISKIPCGHLRSGSAGPGDAETARAGITRGSRNPACRGGGLRRVFAAQTERWRSRWRAPQPHASAI